MTYLLNTKILLLLLFCIGSFSGFSQPLNYAPNEVLIKWKSHVKSAQRNSVKTQLSVVKVKKINQIGVELWKLAENKNITIPEIIAIYKNYPNIEWIEPNYICKTMGIPPNDLYFERSWGLHNVGQNSGTPDADIDALEGWATQHKSPNVKVAIIDSGVDWGHTDLVNNIWQNLGEDADGDGKVLEWNGHQWIFDPGDEDNIDGDGNGYVDDFVGWDFVNNDNNPYDDFGHGTHVAGIIGAEGDNGIGLSGVTWEVQMVALKFIDANNEGFMSDAIAALNYAVNNDIPISNHSWGNEEYCLAMESAIQNAATQNHLLVAAAGNLGLDNDLNTSVYPASYSLTNIISVAATDKNDNRLPASNYGRLSVDLGAPGSGIFSCLPNNDYGTQSGTSLAAPYVTGACALLLEKHPSLSHLALKNEVLNTVDPIAALNGQTVTGGRLNLSRLLGGVNNNNACRTRDSLALVALYNATNGAGWTNEWDLSQPMDTWFGVTTNINGCVVLLHLGINNLVGYIPKELGDLREITSLVLWSNQLSGTIPPELGNLDKLTFFRLSGNQLSGFIPPELGNLSQLELFDLDFNQLNGSIPSQLGNLSSLTSLAVRANQLSGSIPPQLGNLSSLEFLALSDNQLSGSIPPELGDLSNLSTLVLYLNQLDGTIPNELTELNNLDFIRLDRNQLSGIIPSGFGALDKLTVFALDFNQIEGSIPSSLGSLNNLTHFRLNNNQLSGCFPQTFSSFCSINTDFSGNPNLPNGGDFATFCTTQMGACPSCRTTDSLALVALYNATNGPNWTNTWNLNEPINTWYGVTINHNVCVINLNLYDNNLIGYIPPEIGQLDYLQILNLTYNQLSGSIPSEIGNLTTLNELELRVNQLSDMIPSEIGNLVNLTKLDFYANQLSGRIPTEIGNLINLTHLDLTTNQLTGILPIEIGNLTKLSLLNIGENRLNGSIPIEIGLLTELSWLGLFGNQLTGSIPVEIGYLKKLSLLSLSNNNLSGSIPKELAQLSAITWLALNNNNLSGCFPEQFNNLCYLTNTILLDCSFNNNELEGCQYDFRNNPNLPNGGDFTSFCNMGTGECTDPVWPGDFNSDGIANNKDALYWGIACENTAGPVRPSASTQWYPQESPDWSTAVNNVNKKHQDGNGDGLINLQDLQVLRDNFGQTHGHAGISHRTNGVAFRLESLGYTGASRHEYALYIESGENPVSLHGFAGSIDFGDMVVDNALLNITDSSLEPDQAIAIFDPIENKLDIALTRTDKTNKLCDGKVGTLIIIMESLALSGPMSLSVGNGGQMIANGQFSSIASTSMHDDYPAVTLSSNEFAATVSVMHEQCDMPGYAMVQVMEGRSMPNILWSTGATTPKITNLSAGEYSVTLSDNTGWQTTTTVEIKGHFLPSYDENGELMDCAPAICAPTLNLADAQQSGTSQAANTLTASCLIPSSQEVIFKAGESITLQNGFTVATGGIFLATIESCTAANLNNNINLPVNQPITANLTLPPEQPILSVSPNPFRQHTMIDFSLPSSGNVNLAIYDMQGRQLKTLIDGEYREAGRQEVEFYADGLGKGIYFVSLRTVDRVETKKIILVD